MTDALALPGPGELLHFSEDPTITSFTPRSSAAAPERPAYVWAVDEARAPDYWFPRDCPRAMAWNLPTTSEADRSDLIGPGAQRVHLIEYDWLPVMSTTRLFFYRLPAEHFTAFGAPHAHAHVSTVPVTPLGPAEPAGDLIAMHAAAAIELRLMTDLWPFVDRAVASTVGFSGIRLHHARPRPTEARPSN